MPMRRLPGVADRGHQLLVELAGQHHHGDVARLRIGDAQAVDEGGLAAELLQGAAQRRAAAVNDHQLVPFAAEAREWSWQTC